MLMTVLLSMIIEVKIGVVLFNHSSKPFKVRVGDHIAQLILGKIERAEVTEVEELSYAERGHYAFSYTGEK